MPNTRGAFALRCWATEAQAARPASLASSARTEVLEAISSQALAGFSPLRLFGERVCKRSLVFREACLSKFFHSLSAEDFPLVGRASCYMNSMFGKAELELPQTQALRRSAKPNTRGRAGTSCFAARAGGVRLLAGGVTQRTMRAGSGALRPMPNPSIERTNNGGSSLRAFASAQPPLFASHLKR